MDICWEYWHWRTIRNIWISKFIRFVSHKIFTVIIRMINLLQGKNCRFFFYLFAHSYIFLANFKTKAWDHFQQDKYLYVFAI